MKELTFADAVPFIQQIPDHEKLTLVGGQALCFWIEYYAEKFGDLFDQNALITTQDIDFRADQDVVRECAEAWNARHEIPDINDHTPNSGIVIIDYEDDELRVDFLWHIQGIDNKVIEKERFQMILSISEEQSLPFYILSPFLCLVSRVSNVLTLNRTDNHSIDQLKAAVTIVKCLIIQSLDDKEEEMARNIAEDVFKFAVNKSEGIRLFTEFGIDIFEAIPEDERFHPKFLEKRLPRMRAELDEKRTIQAQHREYIDTRSS